jgi:hypothetical protein
LRRSTPQQGCRTLRCAPERFREALARNSRLFGGDLELRVNEKEPRATVWRHDLQLAWVLPAAAKVGKRPRVRANFLVDGRHWTELATAIAHSAGSRPAAQGRARTCRWCGESYESDVPSDVCPSCAPAPARKRRPSKKRSAAQTTKQGDKSKKAKEAKKPKKIDALDRRLPGSFGSGKRR